MAFRAALGDSDFVSIRRQGAVYVNKTAAVAELATSATKVSLFTRPRRFGKSTLLSTLEAFFQRPDLGGGHVGRVLGPGGVALGGGAPAPPAVPGAGAELQGRRAPGLE
ncbi:MAG TPA: AAA family ATPase [Myxococcota bacterium]|nr:AAA family ATPase [Myxococcota bacterium]